jgi:hypothetical protein
MDGFRRDATTWSRTPPVGAAGADNGTRPEAIEPADSDTGILQIPGPRGVARDGFWPGRLALPGAGTGFFTGLDDFSGLQFHFQSL